MLRVASWLRRVVALGLIALSCPAIAAQSAPASAEALRPGQYSWHPEAGPASGPVAVVVSLPLQRAWVFRSGVLIGVSTVSSGQPGYETPVGAFAILEKDADHRSNLYDDAPMPWMLRLTWDGVALHAGHVAAAPASHGCVRLPAAFARSLYEITQLGAAVVITGEAPASAGEALALVSPGPAATAIASNE
jgi:hypothetical protein